METVCRVEGDYWNPIALIDQNDEVANRHPLDGYSKYENAKRNQPASAVLAKEIFDYCCERHKSGNGEPLRLRPEGSAQVIASQPNYFAFIRINTTEVKIVVDLIPSTLPPYKRSFTEEELNTVNLKTRGTKGNRVQMEVKSEEELKIAFKILDFCHAWVAQGSSVALSLFPQVRVASSQGQTRKIGSHRDNQGHD